MSVSLLMGLRATDAVGDPSATRTVYITIVALLIIGVLFVVLGIWLFRRTRPEPSLLAPLEQMDQRSWRQQDPTTQRRLLDDVRPPGSQPVEPTSSPPDVVEEFAALRPVVSFDDLTDRARADDDDAAADDDDAESPGGLDTPATGPSDLPAADPGDSGDALIDPRSTLRVEVVDLHSDLADDDSGGVAVAEGTSAKIDQIDSDETDDDDDADVDADTFELDRPDAVAHDAAMMSSRPVPVVSAGPVPKFPDTLSDDSGDSRRSDDADGSDDLGDDDSRVEPEPLPEPDRDGRRDPEPDLGVPVVPGEGLLRRPSIRD